MIQEKQQLPPVIHHNGNAYRSIGVRLTKNVPTEIPQPFSGTAIWYIDRPIESFIKLKKDRWVVCRAEENLRLAH